MLKKTLIAITLLVVAAGLFLTFSKQPPALPEGSQSAALLKPGPHQVRRETMHLVDTSRKLDANGDFEGADERTFDVLIWSPTATPPTPQPLLVYSHGFMSSGHGGKYLGEYFASHGYTVAAPTFPLSHFSAPGGPNSADVVNQPEDVSYVIDTLLALSADANSKYAAYIDPQRVGAAGLSLGGMTTKLVTYHPHTGDPRITAAASIAGPAFMFSKRFFDHRSLPFMMIATPQDAMISYQDNAADITDKIAGAVLVTIEGASHAGFADTAKWLRWMNNPDSIGCDALMRNLDEVQEESWYHRIGSPEIGVVEGAAPAMCSMDPMPKTINPLRQHQLNTLALAAFMQCHLATNPAEAQRHCDYLHNKLSSEIGEITVRW
ncbi:MAG: hypothetical protein HKN50_13110 [Gammaproteobacteria bacterium]|nr:hypothetical protein [Gammaproteobacteria bacterium]